MVGKRMYKMIYADEEHAQAVHDAFCELMNAHPEWDADIDVTWDESNISCDVCGSDVNEDDIHVIPDELTVCKLCHDEYVADPEGFTESLKREDDDEEDDDGEG